MNTVGFRQPYLSGKVESFMTVDVVTIKEEDSIFSVVEMLLERKLRGVPVVDKAGKLVGLVREGDVVGMFVDREPFVLNSRTVKEIMRKPPLMISPEATLQRAAIRMHVDGTSMLVVVTDDQIVGVLTRTDILKGINWRESD